MIYAAILAGGKGTRMGNTPVPKQFLQVDGKEIIIHTLEKFVINKEIEEIIVAIPKEWVLYTRDLIKNSGLENERIAVVEGGQDRNETIMKAVEYIEKKNGLNEEDVIITHDAVRPFLTNRIIEEHIEKSKTEKAIDTVIKAVDTIVVSYDGKEIEEIPVRDEMYQGQTPQTFNIKSLKKHYESLSDKQKEILSDACKIFLMKGEKIAMVRGEDFNIKVTTAFDLSIANAITKGKISVD